MRNGKEKMPLNLHENNKFVRMDEKVKNRNFLSALKDLKTERKFCFVGAKGSNIRT